MLTDITANLLAGGVGFLLAQAYAYVRQVYSQGTAKWFWAPTDSTKIQLCYGEWAGLLSNLGEDEPLIGLRDALNLGELRMFLQSHFSEIVILQNRAAIDWRFPVVSMGGPLPNALTKEIGESGVLPIWFLDMPYKKRSERAIGSSGRAEVFKSVFNEDGQLVTDVGFVARIRYPRNAQQFLYIIAGNYGVGKPADSCEHLRARLVIRGIVDHAGDVHSDHLNRPRCPYVTDRIGALVGRSQSRVFRRRSLVKGNGGERFHRVAQHIPASACGSHSRQRACIVGIDNAQVRA